MATKQATKEKASRTVLSSGKTPLTMEELLASEEFRPKPVRRGEVVEGTIVSVSPSEVLVDIGGKSEGMISGRELGEGNPDLKVGEKILAYVMQSEDESGQTILSIKRAGGEKRWRELQIDFNSGNPVELQGIETNRGGLVVDLGGVRGFIPSSQLDGAYAGSRGVGKSFSAKVIELDRKGNRLILSQKSLTQEANRKKFEEAATKFSVGEVLSGRVSGVMPYGLFVTLDEGLEGLVHISEVSWERVNSLTELYKIGDEVKVKVLSIDPGAGRINLSIKALAADPWKEKLQQLKPGLRVKGKIAKSTQFGIFVELPQGVDGLIHTSKIPAYMVEIKPGEELDLVVESVNAETRRISLLVDEGDINELKPIEELVEDAFSKNQAKEATKMTKKGIEKGRSKEEN